jgi:prepilin-type N-terminal cleavage/methylation domain-containing protein/prepilin-type processing-associated H-X9-DG protein
MSANARNRGFTLLELLVVLAIIAIVVGLTLSGVQKVRATSARAKCLNNLRQLNLGLHQYHDQFGAFPAGYTPDTATSRVRLSWHSRVLPFVEQEPLWQQILRAYASDPAPHTSSLPAHRAIQRQPVPVFFCPADPRPQVGTVAQSSLPVSFTSYLGVNGQNKLDRAGILYSASAVKLTHVPDGTSNTILLGERPPPGSLVYGWWYGGLGDDAHGSIEVVLGSREINRSVLDTGSCPPGPYKYQPGAFTDDCSRFHFWSPHAGGANFAFADGSVRFLRYSADDIMPALATRAGGEVVAVPD